MAGKKNEKGFVAQMQEVSERAFANAARSGLLGSRRKVVQEMEDEKKKKKSG